MEASTKIYTWSTKKIANGLFMAIVKEIMPLERANENGQYADVKTIHTKSIKGNRAKSTRYAKAYTRYIRASA